MQINEKRIGRGKSGLLRDGNEISLGGASVRGKSPEDDIRTRSFHVPSAGLLTVYGKDSFSGSWHTINRGMACTIFMISGPSAFAQLSLAQCN